MDLCLRNDSAPFGAVTAAQLTVRPPTIEAFYLVDAGGRAQVFANERDKAGFKGTWYQDRWGPDRSWESLRVPSRLKVIYTFHGPQCFYESTTTDVVYDARALLVGTALTQSSAGATDSRVFLVIVRRKTLKESWGRVGLLDFGNVGYCLEGPLETFTMT